MVDRSRNRLRVTLASSSISGNAMKWKCRNSLAVIGFLPPPGGPIAATKFTSWICRNDPISFRSYHPETFILDFNSGGRGATRGIGVSRCAMQGHGGLFFIDSLPYDLLSKTCACADQLCARSYHEMKPKRARAGLGIST